MFSKCDLTVFPFWWNPIYRSMFLYFFNSVWLFTPSQCCKNIVEMLQQHRTWRCKDVAATSYPTLQRCCSNIVPDVAKMLQQRCKIMLQRFPFATNMQHLCNVAMRCCCNISATSFAHWGSWDSLDALKQSFWE